LTYLKILLIRHAQSLGNIQRLMEGQSSTELSALGQDQAQRLSRALVSIGGHAQLPTHVYTSPLLRAAQTAQPLTEALQQANHSFTSCQMNGLKEIDQGIFQGMTWPQAQMAYPEICTRLLSSLAWQPVPGAESPTAARERASNWISHLLNTHQPGETIWVVSHEGILQHIIAALLGCDRTWRTKIAHTAIFEFWLAASQWQHLAHNRFNPEYWQIRRFNDSSHLTDKPQGQGSKPT